MAIVTEQVWTKRDFVDLARRQKQFLATFLLVFLLGAATVFVPEGNQSLVRGVTFFLSLASLYFVYRLVAAVLPPSSTWIIVAYFVLSFIPFVDLLLLVYLNNLATKRLRLTGLSVGFIGAKIAKLEKLPEDFTATVTV
jgi:hypothetical protein